MDRIRKRRLFNDLFKAARFPASVTFHIRFTHHVKAKLVAQFIKPRIVRIMRGADGVDIVLLHHGKLFSHPFDRHRIAGIRKHIVTVDAEKFNRSTVDFENAAGRGNFPES